MDEGIRRTGREPHHTNIVRSTTLFSVSKSLVFTGLLLFVAVHQFWKLSLVGTIVNVLAFLSWLLALKDSDRTSRIVSLTLVAVGTVLFASAGASFIEAVSAFAENTHVLMVMVLVPLVGTVIEIGGYPDSLTVICTDLKEPLLLHFVASVLAYATGSVLLNGSIALVWAIMVPVVKKVVRDADTLLASSVPRGYNASLLWSPAGPPMAVALGLTGISWSSVLGPGLTLSLVMLALATVVEVKNLTVTGNKPSESFARTGDPGRPPNGCQNGVPCDKEKAWRKTGSLGLGLASFIGGVVYLENLGLTPIQAMVPAVMIAVPAWSLLIGKPKETLVASSNYVCRKIPDLTRQYLLMTTAGFIGTAVSLFSGAGGPAGFLSALSRLPGGHVLVFTLLTSALVWLVSIMGIHPLIGMSVVYSLVSPIASVYPRQHVALTLLLGSVLGFNISPVSATMLVTSSCCGKSTIETGVRLQWKFVLSMWVTGSVLLSLLTRG